jgi:small multidrug resistance pump
MSHWTCLAIAIVAEVIGTSFLKSSEGFTRLLPSAIVVVAYLIAFYFLGLTLKTLPVGIAYAVWAGAGVAPTWRPWQAEVKVVAATTRRLGRNDAR